MNLLLTYELLVNNPSYYGVKCQENDQRIISVLERYSLNIIMHEKMHINTWMEDRQRNLQKLLYCLCLNTSALSCIRWIGHTGLDSNQICSQCCTGCSCTFGVQCQGKTGCTAVGCLKTLQIIVNIHTLLLSEIHTYIWRECRQSIL